MNRASRSGFSLVEVVLACALTSLLLVVLGAALNQAQLTFRNVMGTSEASDELRKVCLRLRQELLQTSVSQTSAFQYPAASWNSKSSLGGNPDGQAIWFLSNLEAETAVGNHNGTPQFLADGSPFWQRNILYYIVIPTNHATLFGWNCTGGAGPGGFDDRCPHKVMIRKEIDFGVATTPGGSETTVEQLIPAANIGTYLTAPVGYKVAAMYGTEGPSLKDARIVGRGLLTFQVSVPAPGSIAVDTRAVSIARARTKVQLGIASMFTSPYTFQFGMTVSPSVP